MSKPNYNAEPLSAVSARSASDIFLPEDIEYSKEFNVQLSAFYVLEDILKGECGEYRFVSDIRKDYNSGLVDKEEYPTFGDLLEELTAMGGYFYPCETIYRMKVNGRWLVEDGEYFTEDDFSEMTLKAFDVTAAALDRGKKPPTIEIVAFKSSSALDTIYRNINKNIPYGKDVLDVRFPYFCTALAVTASGNIFWRNYGSSANANTLKDLLWIIQVIFRTSPEGFLTEYIPETKSCLLTGVRCAE